jgi:glycerol-3-phosphate acyltransferase PlsY
MALSLALLVSYLLGSIPTAYLLAKWAKGIDIRTMGSGNVGATNALRTVGLWAGVVVLVSDGLKGVIAACVIPRWLRGSATPDLSLVCGLAAVLGHDFPCFLRFRGGKGVASTIGVLLGSVPIVAGIVVVVWLFVFGVFRYVSLGSIAAAVAIPFSQLALHQSLRELLIGSCLAILILVRHRANIGRLLKGVEHRAWSRKSD